MKLAKFKTIMAAIAMGLMILLALGLSFGISLGREKKAVKEYTDPDNGETINTDLSDLATNIKTVVDVARRMGLSESNEYKDANKYLDAVSAAGTLSSKYDAAVDAVAAVEKLAALLEADNGTLLSESDKVKLLDAKAVIDRASYDLTDTVLGTSVMEDYKKQVREFNEKINRFPYIIVKPFVGEISE